jgi:hypothetical protein
MPLSYLWLIPLGVAVGLFGTLIGAGGGFLLVPLLLLFFPHDDPATITSISLGVVFFNALMGSAAYARMRRINYKAGLLFAAAGIPGAALGAMATHLFARHIFEMVMGFVLLIVAGYITWQAGTPQSAPQAQKNHAGVVSPSYNVWLGLLLSLGVGFFSSLLGIGGGIIHVPALTYLLDFPVHSATATSHFILAILAFTGTLTHVLSGTFQHGWRRMTCLAVGVIIGAPIGARLSNRISAVWIARSLAAALGLVGLRLVIRGL